jgi:hypothetical protein
VTVLVVEVELVVVLRCAVISVAIIRSWAVIRNSTRTNTHPDTRDRDTIAAWALPPLAREARLSGVECALVGFAGVAVMTGVSFRMDVSG